MITSINLYILFILLVGIQRLGELVISSRNERYLKDKGAIEVGHSHFFYMKLLHFLWPISCIVEALVRKEPPSLFVILTFLSIFLIGQALRIIAITTLGKRWSVKIFVLPGEEPVAKGIFKYIRHPNYLGVIFEIFSMPMIFGGWWTAIVFTVLNGWLLKVRILKEEKALEEANQYGNYFAKKARFVPGGKNYV